MSFSPINAISGESNYSWNSYESNSTEHVTNQVDENPIISDETDTCSNAYSSTSTTYAKPFAHSNNTSNENLDSLIVKMDDLLSQIKKAKQTTTFSDNDHFGSDIIHFRMMLESLAKQRSSKEEGSSIAQATLFKHQEISKALQKKSHAIQDEIQSLQKTSDGIWWADLVLTGGSVIGLLASLAATLLTGGGAFSSIILSLKALTDIAKGINGGVKGYYEYHTNQRTSELFGVKENRQENHRKIEVIVKDMKEITDYMQEHWQQLKNLQKNYHSATKFN